jgi:DNA-binding NarL/FixJ family response regulator
LREIVGLRIVGEVSDGLVQFIWPNQTRVDYPRHRASDTDGIKAARQIRELSPESKLSLTMESLSWRGAEAFNLGAWGYVLKAKAAAGISIAVRGASDTRFVSPRLVSPFA